MKKGNGLQHLSQMTQDTNLAKYVNIFKSNKEDIPEDVYTYMVHRLNEKIKEFSRDIKYVKLTYINIIRKFIKLAIMTIPYGSTKRGIAEKLKEEHFKFAGYVEGKPTFTLIKDIYKKDNINFYLTHTEINKLASVIHELLYDSFESLKVLVKYLKDMNRLLKILRLSSIWMSPGGLIIEQKYVKFNSINKTTSILGRKKSITIKEPIRNDINLRKQNEAIMPNIVHSFDASNIALLIKELLKNNNSVNIYTVHDCWATNANDVELMFYQVKMAFLLLYSNELFVTKYHNFIINYIKFNDYKINEDNEIVITCRKRIQIPDVPNFEYKKEFENNILGSQYFLN
jgi:DNA-directed RNA polymerase